MIKNVSICPSSRSLAAHHSTADRSCGKQESDHLFGLYSKQGSEEGENELNQ